MNKGRAELDLGAPLTEAEIHKHVAEKVLDLRLKRGLTQTDVADAIGVSFQEVQKYEQIRKRISVSQLIELANLFRVSIDYFFEILPQRGETSMVK